MHSAKLIKQKYPNLTRSVIASLYGFNASHLSEDEVESVTGLDLLQFYVETRANIVPIKCQFNNKNCKHILKQRYSQYFYIVSNVSKVYSILAHASR